jgi:hypothetical protein
VPQDLEGEGLDQRGKQRQPKSDLRCACSLCPAPVQMHRSQIKHHLQHDLAPSTPTTGASTLSEPVSRQHTRKNKDFSPYSGCSVSIALTGNIARPSHQ